MKRDIKIASFFHAALAAFILLTTAACEEEFTRDAGTLPPTDGANYGMLRDAEVLSKEKVVMIHDGVSVQETLTFTLMKPAEDALSLDITPDLNDETVRVWNDKNGLEDLIGQGGLIWARRYKPFPIDRIAMANNGVLSIAQKQATGNLILTLNVAGLEEGRYLLPVKITSATGIETLKGSDVFYYRIHIFKKGESPSSAWEKPYVFAGFVDVSIVQPQIALEWQCMMSDWDTFEDFKTRCFDIINLVAAVVQYDAATGLPTLYNNKDMSYVLSHREKYIDPLIDVGIKVCLTIKGGGQGIGFCNLTDKQRESLVAQVKNTVDAYQLDGVSLWDEESNYGSKPELPAVDPASYPRFIKALRDAMPDKMITLVDIGDPTANFDQVYDGIEIGRCIDFAWTGYELEGVNPWGENAHGRKPIAGMDKKRYGGLSVVTTKRSLKDQMPAIFQEEIDENYNPIYPNLQTFYDGSGLYHTFATTQISPFTHTKEPETSGQWWGFLTSYYPGYVLDWMMFSGKTIGAAQAIPGGKFSLGGYINNYYIPDWK